ncbi:LPXTG cell wall anchor domain-containing protein [Microbacterium sp. STN6]|uniref:DUF7927 domain-containing protein n=1 Tax=Microbacterium sp. STN6 TaxID=2995588 RepID=UPI002260ED5F|nr:LPXTG cell wall anchor domain-containing protein [Microbacterium sp. STN6]MCX7523206.1 LPXTG cell wall anchor domain-containing protein [Microbacterium sp. STN6]
MRSLKKTLFAAFRAARHDRSGPFNRLTRYTARVLAPTLIVGVALTGFAPAPASADPAAPEQSTTSSAPATTPPGDAQPTSTPAPSASQPPAPGTDTSGADAASTPPHVDSALTSTRQALTSTAPPSPGTSGQGGYQGGTMSSTITIVKNVVDESGATLSSELAGWQFTLNATAPADNQSLNTDASGTASFSVPVTNGATSTVTIAETARSGYAVKPLKTGENAQCRGNSFQPTVTNVGLNGFSLAVGGGQNITCTITNVKSTPASWTVSKSSNPPAGSTVVPGDTITYTLTLTHTGGSTPASLVLTDDLSKAFTSAAMDGVPLASNGTYAFSGNNLLWTVTDFSTTQTLVYTMRVNKGAYGVDIRNALIVPPGGTCVGVCVTDHLTPKWNLSKTSNPVTGSLVQPGETVTYTLHADNSSAGTVTGAIATDDLSNVLAHAALVSPLPAGLAFDTATNHLTWSIGNLASGDSADISYSVVIDKDAAGVGLRNVVTPSLGGFCPSYSTGLPDNSTNPRCDTVHRVPLVNLSIVKTHDPVLGDAVDSGEGSTLLYRLTIENNGADAATGVTVSDPLPAGLGLDGAITAPTGWSAQVVAGVMTATYAGNFAAGATAEISYTVKVGTLSRSGGDVPFPDIENTACVKSSNADSDLRDNCSTDRTKVKSVAVTADAICLADAPVVRYSLTPYNMATLPTVAIIWWTTDGYAHRDPSIDASNKAALLANGAEQVNYVPVPAGWTSGETISGTQLWPGAAVDANGNPTAWPGWRQLSTGQWVLDPSTPFYNLRNNAVVEVRINPTTGATITYPPPSPNCDPMPPRYHTAGHVTALAVTGSDDTPGLAVAGFLLLTGVLMSIWVRRRRLRERS